MKRGVRWNKGEATGVAVFEGETMQDIAAKVIDFTCTYQPDSFENMNEVSDDQVHSLPWIEHVPANPPTMVVVRGLRVNRSQTPVEALAACGATLSVDEEIVATMPQGKGELIDLYIFRYPSDAPQKRIRTFDERRPMAATDDDLEQQFIKHRFATDPYSLLALLETDPISLKSYPHGIGTHWKNPQGQWCMMCVGPTKEGGRHVIVERSAGLWELRSSFAGAKPYIPPALEAPTRE